MNGTLFLMMGAPGSGKSTWLAEHVNPTCDVVISRDTVRFSMVAEDEEYFSKEKEVFKEFIRQIDEALMSGYNVFADATHLNRASRNKLLRAINVKPAGVAVIWIKVPVDIALKQNENRKDTRAYVPRSVIRRMDCQIEKPEFEEGFDTIYIVERDKPITMLKNWEDNKDVLPTIN